MGDRSTRSPSPKAEVAYWHPPDSRANWAQPLLRSLNPYGLLRGRSFTALIDIEYSLSQYLNFEGKSHDSGVTVISCAAPTEEELLSLSVF